MKNNGKKLTSDFIFTGGEGRPGPGLAGLLEVSHLGPSIRSRASVLRVGGSKPKRNLGLSDSEGSRCPLRIRFGVLWGLLEFSRIP